MRKYIPAISPGINLSLCNLFLENVRKATKPRTHLCSHSQTLAQTLAQTLDWRAHLLMAGEMPASLEKLREKAQYELTVRPVGFFGVTAQKIVNSF